jgi:hypothetical protein
MESYGNRYLIDGLSNIIFRYPMIRLDIQLISIII